MEDCCLFLRGEVYLADASSECSPGITGLSGCGELPKTYTKLGNTSLLEANVASSVIGRENIFNKAVERSRVNIESVSLDLTIECASMSNMVQAFFGDKVKYDSDEREDRFCFSKSDKTYLLTRLPSGDHTVALLDSFGNTTTFLVEGVDYLLTDNKVTLVNPESLPDAVTLEVTYAFESVRSYELNALELSPTYKELVFVGKNATGESDETFEVKYFRVLFAPLAVFDLISKGQFLNLPLTGTVEESINGWFKIKRQFGGSNESGSVIY